MSFWGERVAAVPSADPSEELREAIRTACAQVAEHPEFTSKVRRWSPFWPIADTQWHKRSGDWVPADPYVFIRRMMPKRQMERLCERLKSYRADDGSQVVSAPLLGRIRQAWERYRHSEFFADEYLPKEFDKALANANTSYRDIEDCDAFRTFLFTTVYPLVVEGRCAEAKKTCAMVLSAVCATGKPTVPKSKSEKIRKLQIESCVALLAFTSYVGEDGAEAAWVARIRRMQSASENEMFLRGRVLSHGGHHVVGSRNFGAVLELHLHGAQLDIPTYERASTACFHNAARASLEAGALMSTRLKEAEGRTVDWMLKKGRELSGEHRDLDTNGRHLILEAVSLTNDGRFDDALEVAMQVRESIGATPQKYKHLELRLSRIEAVIYARLSDRAPQFRHVVRERLMRAETLAKELRLPMTVKNIRRQMGVRLKEMRWD